MANEKKGVFYLKYMTDFLKMKLDSWMKTLSNIQAGSN